MNSNTIKNKSINDFPTTRYQGSKRKILGWLYDHFKDLEFNSVLDAFGGTGAVSYLFKVMSKEVTFNDELHFNYQIGKALIENDNVALSHEEISSIISVHDVKNYPVFIQKNFSEIYFTNEENLWLDKFIHKINLDGTFEGNPEEVEVKKALSLFSLYQASLTKRPYNLFHRKNLYMRLNDVQRNFGNKKTWERSFAQQIEKFALEANRAIFKGDKACRAINESVFDLENNGYDLVYFDPPYVNKKGDHDTIDYLYCYHFLEGVSKYAKWNDLIDFDSKNLRFRKELHSDHFKKKNVKDSFEKLCDVFQKSIIAISYKANGVPSIEEIEEILKGHNKKVKKVSKPYIYALNKQNGDAKTNREVLIIGY